MEYKNEMRGVLFPNSKDGNDRRPDFKGTINVAGVDYQLSAWKKSSKAGAPYLSLSVSEKRDQAPRQQEAPKQVARPAAVVDPFDDPDLPF